MSDILAVVNVILSAGIIYASVRGLKIEHRQNYKWIWYLTTFIGLVWLFLYTSDIVDLPLSIRALMGTGIVRASITATLGTLLGLIFLFQAPRHA